ncbi:MAG: ribosome biogenesis GTPase YlqF [Mastigocoleus sp. MO_167.B18]|uniref:ribosome biogenesis GTPase YlqF n=1 Tax=Mastigocoleus sp. MO_188.B34 TaxID=3036635 RepID=UPI00263775C7|nr:ribosome biogenesis GTPase YlqF [Mastigocoleus sp. MO_188.B34]MDJ0696492.1 ribosome biogenesis GTPase YlqF [Mastigocoleus sp. MO_188.B34]MDJ0773741.1 ribosome biogenesis GTPase YlqF [Mastigocoleus sp. MO_167.B18]
MAITQHYKLNLIQWYPGHIAKAEKALKEQLKLVDVVLEVRDARIPLATHHPMVDEWVGNKTKVLVMNRVDMISPTVKQIWTDWFKQQGERALFTNAQQGKGVTAISKAAQAAGTQINQKRHQRGMLPRPVRAVVIGFPNVGKSALINRLVKRRVVESAARPGVTRQLRWVRISKELELLDAPGVIPIKLEDQEAALKLAICDDIGEASYDNQLVAAGFIDIVNYLMATVNTETTEDGTVANILPAQVLMSRYEIDPSDFTGDEFLHALAKNRYQGDVERAARKILTDFRRGSLGQIPLDLPLDLGLS